ncbi:MAG: hypothetical protein ACOCWK_04595 [Tangfeifania sp.]
MAVFLVLRIEAKAFLATFVTSSYRETRLNFSKQETSKTQIIKNTTTLTQLKNAERPNFCSPSVATTPKPAGGTVSSINIIRLLISIVSFDPQFLQSHVVLKTLKYSKTEYL